MPSCCTFHYSAIFKSPKKTSSKAALDGHGAAPEKSFEFSSIFGFSDFTQNTNVIGNPSLEILHPSLGGGNCALSVCPSNRVCTLTSLSSLLQHNPLGTADCGRLLSMVRIARRTREEEANVVVQSISKLNHHQVFWNFSGSKIHEFYSIFCLAH